jgi:cell division protein FtsB
MGHGSVAYVKELQQQIHDQNVANALEKAENDRLASEVNDLKDGLAMVEEKARSELGMVKPNEIFVQIVRR